MTQRERVLKMLRDAGERGVRSDAFYREFLGRGVARIYDLRQDGHEISSEREGKYTRYRLVGVGAAKSPGSANEGEPGLQSVSDLHSGEQESAGVGAGTRGDGHRASVEQQSAEASSFPSASLASADSDAPTRLFALPSLSAQTNREAA